MKKWEEESAKKEKTFLYDIGRSKHTKFDPKAHRDKHFLIGRKEERDVGPYYLSSRDFGSDAWKWKYSKPEFGPISYVKHFYDKSHISTPGF